MPFDITTKGVNNVGGAYIGPIKVRGRTFDRKSVLISILNAQFMLCVGLSRLSTGEIAKLSAAK